MALDQLFSIFLGSENWILPEFPELKTNKQTIKKKKKASRNNQPPKETYMSNALFSWMGKQPLIVLLKF